MRRIHVLIIDGQSPYAVSVARALGATGRYRIGVLSTKRWRPVRFCRHVRWFDGPIDSVGLLDRVAEAVRDWKMDVLLPVDEAGIRFAAANHDALSELAALAPGPVVEAFDAALDKWRFAQAVRGAGLPHPPTMLLRDRPELTDQLEGFPFPAMVKPTVGGNGFGIARLDDARSVAKHLSQTPRWSGRTLLQAFIPGRDIDCSILAVRGEIAAHTIQQPLTDTDRLDFKPSGAIELGQNQQVLDMARRLARAMNWTGVAHIDLRIDQRDGQAYLIEMNPRFWGSLLASVQARVNFPDLACRLALKLAIPEALMTPGRYFSGGTAIRAMASGQAAGRCRARFSETALRQIVCDPGPELVEIFQYWSRR